MASRLIGSDAPRPVLSERRAIAAGYQWPGRRAARQVSRFCAMRLSASVASGARLAVPLTGLVWLSPPASAAELSPCKNLPSFVQNLQSCSRARAHNVADRAHSLQVSIKQSWRWCNDLHIEAIRAGKELPIRAFTWRISEKDRASTERLHIARILISTRDKSRVVPHWELRLVPVRSS